MKISITGDWPNTKSDITQLLIEDIISSFSQMVQTSSLPNLIVQNEPNRDCPRACYVRVDDFTVILLSSKRGSLWSKIAYQLSHELCHVYSNFSEQPSHFKWLEESFCELASLCNMIRMSESWKTNPPMPCMIGYEPNLRKYVDEIIAKITQPEVFSVWLEENLHELKKDPYLRDLNAIVAAQLMPLFLEDSNLWKAIGHLNQWHVHPEDDLDTYFTCWENVCTPDIKTGVTRIRQRLTAL